jgi:hypothetical protein
LIPFTPIQRPFSSPLPRRLALAFVDRLTDTTGRPTANKLAWAGSLALLTLALASIALPVGSIGFIFERNYNEGWNAYHAARAASGEALYGSQWHPVNYPFLSFYLIGWLTPLFGDPLLIGRFLNVVALLAVAGCAALIVRRLDGGGPGMVLAAACVLALQQLQASRWVASDEPQMLAEALVLAGLAIYVSGPIRWGRLAACALFLAAGGFVKQIVVAIPVAITIDLLVRDRRWFLPWCLCLAVAIGFLLAASEAVAGSGAFADVLAPRPYHWGSIVYNGRKFLSRLKAPLIGSLILLALPVLGRWASLLRCYGAASLLGAVFFSGGDGLSNNVYLEPCVAMGIIGGVALGRWRSADRSPPVFRALALLAAVSVAAPLIASGPKSLAALADAGTAWRLYRQHEAEFRVASARLRAQPGAALCESLLLCFEAGKALTVDPFGARTQILSGQAAESALIADIAEHRFAVIVLPTTVKLDPGNPSHIVTDVLTRARFTPATLSAIARSYVLTDELIGAAFYLPREDGCGARCTDSALSSEQ